VAHNPKSIKELLRIGGGRLGNLQSRAESRGAVLTHVRAALSPALAAKVVTAGLERGQLTLGVAGACWAARLRYATAALRTQVGQSMTVDVLRVRIKVVPPST